MTKSPRNPYRPGVGLQPLHLAGREDDFSTFKSVLSGAPEIPANVRMTGLRGVGKTVLLRELQSTADDEHWATISVELEPRHGSDSAFSAMIKKQSSDLKSALSIAARTRMAAKAIGDAARRALTVSVDGVTWSAGGELDASTQELAEELLDATRVAVETGKEGLMLFFDEAQILMDSKLADGDHPLSSLIASVSTLQKLGIPIGLTLCGLPTLTVNLLRARTYSERMFRGIDVGKLTETPAREALTVPLNDTGITADAALVDRVVEDVDGYPYFIQLWGAELWDTTVQAGLPSFEVSTLDLIEERIHKRLDNDFYAPRVDSLTPAEQDVLLATASCVYPPLRVSELNNMSPKSPENINVLLGRLVSANVLYRPRKGEYRYTAPQFREYLQRRLASPDH